MRLALMTALFALVRCWEVDCFCCSTVLKMGCRFCCCFRVLFSLIVVCFEVVKVVRVPTLGSDDVWVVAVSWPNGQSNATVEAGRTARVVQ